MKLEEAAKWIGKNACIHWNDPHLPNGGGSMEGRVSEVGGDWMVVDWGYGVLIEHITAIHPADEPCPSV